MTSDEEFTDIGDDQKSALKMQISEQLNCSVQLLTEVDIVQSGIRLILPKCIIYFINILYVTFNGCLILNLTSKFEKISIRRQAVTES
jgi:hypothetical protein